MATNTRSKGKNAPPGAFPATSSSRPTGKSSSRPGDPSSSSSLPSSSSNTPATLSDVERIASTIRNVNLNGTTSSSNIYVVSDSEDDQVAQYGGQSHHGGSSKGKGGSGNTNNNNGRKHGRRKSIVRSSGPADELGLLVEELQAASGGSTARPKGKGKGRADNHHHQPQQQQQQQHHHQETPTARLVMKPPRSPDKGTSSASNSRKDAAPSVIEVQHSYSSDSEARHDKSKIAKLEREIAALKRQLAPPHRSASHAKSHLQADMDRLRKEVADQAAEIQSLKTKNNEAQSKLSAVEEALMCQICAGVMHKPYALSPCGHVCCLTCLQEWFQSQRDNEDEDGGSRNRKTCPHCRAKIRSRPVQVFVVKAVVEALGIEPEEEPAPLPGSAPTASPSGASDDPWHGIFAETYDGEDDEEVEDYYIGHDEDDLDVCEACGADFDLDGYCVGCGAPADFGYGYSDEDEDEEDAASDGGPGSSPSSDEEVVWQDPMGHSDNEYDEDDQGPELVLAEEDPDNWTLPRPAPPMQDLSREEHSHLNYQEFALCSRGVPFDMIHKYRMQYDSTRGISLQAEHQFATSVFLRFTTTAIRRTRTVWVGWNLLGIDEMDVDGTAYVNGILRDMRDRPYRWMEVPTTGGGISVYRLVRKLGPEDVDYGSDVDVSEPVI